MPALRPGIGAVTLSQGESRRPKPTMPHSLTLPPPLNLIGGHWQAAASGRELPMISPIDGQPFATIADSGAQDVDAAVAAARAALAGDWGRLTAAERGRLMLRLALRIEAEAEALAVLETRDNGKPIAQSRADLAALARYLEYYGGAADKLHGETIPFLNGHDARSQREPHGVTGHIIPWNYPVQILGRSVGAALAMGNATVTKPAEDACLTVLRIAALAGEAGFPPRRDQCRHRPGRGRGPGAGRTPRRRFHQLHRLARGRARDRHRGGAQPHPLHAGTGRQVAADRL